MSLFLSEIAKNRPFWLLLVVFMGIAYGLLVTAFFLSLESTYATFVSAAIIAPFPVIILRNSKHLLLAVLSILLPVTVDITISPQEYHVGGRTGYMISIYDMVLVVLYILWITELITKKQRNINFFPTISLPACSLIGFVVLSVFTAKHPNFSLYETVEIAKMYLTFLYIANNIRSRNELKFLLICLLLGLSFEGVLGIAQHRYGEPFFPTALGGPAWIDSRIMGTWHSPNDFAWYLTFILPISVALLFTETSLFLKLLSLFSFTSGSAALAWTSSRAGWIGFGVALLFIAVLVIGKIRATKKKYINIYVILLLALFSTTPLGPKFHAKLSSRFTGDDGGSFESRFPQYQMAYRIIKDNPFLGVGINNYTEVMRKYDNTEEGIDSITLNPVHNIFLHMAAETGIWGLAAFMWMVAAIFIQGIKFVMISDSFVAYAVIGALGGILAFLVHGLVDVESLGGKVYLFLWFFGGIICASEEIETRLET